MSILLDSIFLTHTSKGVRAEMCEAFWWMGALRGTETARDNDIGRAECRALAARALETFEAQHGGARPAAKTTKKKTTHTDETTIIEPDPEDDPEEDPDDDDDDDDQDDDAARAKLAATSGPRKGDDVESLITQAVRAMGLTGEAAEKFVRDSRRAHAAARPSLASAPAVRLPSMTIAMTAEDMAQPKAKPQRAAVASPTDPPMPTIALGPWSDVAPPRGAR